MAFRPALGFCLTIEKLAFFLIDACTAEIDDALDTQPSYFYPNIYFQSHLNSECMNYIPYLSVLKGY
jgi:hypothetical protein